MFGIELGSEVAIFVLVLPVVRVVFGIEFDMGSEIGIVVFLLLVEIALQLAWGVGTQARLEAEGVGTLALFLSCMVEVVPL